VSLDKRSLFRGVVCAAGFGLLACTETNAPDRTPASLEIVSGQEQSGTVGEELPSPIVARVLNGGGNPIAGQIVNFRVVKGDGSVFAGAAISNADGVVKERWTLGKSIADSQVVEARAVDASSGAALVFGRFVATAVAGPPATLDKVAGDSQTEIAGAVLPDSLRVVSKDAYGNPVSNATVTWSVQSGGGTLGRGTSVTTANGFASNKWTLGTSSDAQTVSATIGTGLSSQFQAHSVGAGELALRKKDGDLQSALPGSAVAVAPSVYVVDSAGIPRPGVTVTFAVQTGGGSVTGGSAVSDAQGVAKVGQWTLGPNVGTNQLSATLPNGNSVTFNASAVQTSSNVPVTIISPTYLVGDTAFIVVQAPTSTTVRATLAGRQTNLKYEVGLGPYRGKISLVGAPRDTMTLVVTGTDANGQSSQAVATLLHDSPARITVSQPMDSSVVQGTTQVDASCVDDDPAGGCTLSVSVEDGPILVGPSPSPLHVSISLDQYDGKLVALLITAKDSKDQSSVLRRMVWVETSSHLQSIGTAEGTVLAVSGTRLLWYTGSTVGIRQGGSSETLTTSLDGLPQAGVGLSFLTPSGALLATTASTSPYAPLLYLWSNGSLTTKALTTTSSLAASGNYVIYNMPPGLVGALYRTDVTSGSEIKIDSTASNTNNSVSENGDVAFWAPPGEIVRYRNGAKTSITSDGGSPLNFYPLTDGTNIVFLRSPSGNPNQFEIWLYDGSTLSMLAPSRTGDPHSVTDYVVNGGWTAFTKDDGAGGFQVWTRAPAGALQAVPGSGSSPKIRALGPDGSVIFDSGINRYYAAPGGTPTRVSSIHGTAVWDSGHFVMILGSTALTVNP
jgi:hypothetical protein